jgi:hypothetical protein
MAGIVTRTGEDLIIHARRRLAASMTCHSQILLAHLFVAHFHLIFTAVALLQL